MALRGLAGAALAVCLAVVACTPSAEPRTRSFDEPRCLSGAGIPEGKTGVIYAAAGEDPYNAELYEIELGRRICMRQLTEGARISEVTAGDGMLIVSNARGIIGDRIELFRDGRFQPVPQIGRPYAFGPALSPDGRTLAFIAAHGPGNRVKAIVVISLSDGHRTRLFASRSSRELPGGIAWGPAGELAFPYGDRRQQHLVIVPLPGNPPKLIADQDVWAPTIRWHPGDLIALGAPIAFREGRTLLLTPDGGEVALIEGWSPVGWWPSGGLLLLQRRDGTLGFATGPRWRPRILGPSPVGPIYSASGWLEGPIPGVVPQRTEAPPTGSP